MGGIVNKIYISALSRGGSNVIAALLHNHEELYTVARRDWSQFRNKGSINIPKLSEHLSKTKKSIYYRGGFQKDLSKVKYFVFDKYLEKDFDFKCPEKDLVLTVVRNPFAIVNSMDNFGKKYDFKAWRQNKKTINKIIGFRFVEMIKNCRGRNKITIQFEDLIKDYNKVLADVHTGIGVPYIPHTSFEEVFANNGCIYCGGKFKVEETDCSDASTVLVERNLKFAPRLHFCCENDNAFTLGYGGFNPCQEISEPKGWRDSMTESNYECVYSHISDKLGEDIAKKFSDNNVTLNDILNIEV
jgi:hypothetical protein